jgi:putative Mn2+ efflux pump MntP
VKLSSILSHNFEDTMDLIPAFIGIGLSMDFFLVSLVIGTNIKNTAHLRCCHHRIQLWFISGWNDGVIGWVAGTSLIGLLSAYDHWIAFLLLAIVGGKMIWEGTQGDEEEVPLEIIRPVTVIIL